MSDNINDPAHKKVDVEKLKRKLEIGRYGNCPVCLAGAAVVEYKGTRICKECYDRLITTEVDTFIDAVHENDIHTIDLCWDMLKSHIKSKQCNRDEVVRLKDAIKSLLEHLTIGI